MATSSTRQIADLGKGILIRRFDVDAKDMFEAPVESVRREDECTG
jgi:hypothetical protein